MHTPRNTSEVSRVARAMAELRLALCCSIALLGCGVQPASTSTGATATSSLDSSDGPAPDLPAETSTGADESDSGDEGPPQPKYDLVPDSACLDPSKPDCAPDERCRPCAVDGWSACQSLAEQPGAKADACTISPTADGLTDDCGAGLYCVDADGRGGTKCAELCAAGDTCLDADEACTSVAAVGCTASICSPTCDPIAQDCDGGQACFFVNNGPSEVPVCIAPWPWEAELGQPCSAHLLDSCAPGLVCGDGPLPGCIPSDFTGCCTPFCSVALQDCPFGEPGVTCQPYYVNPPAGYEDLGVCVAA